MPRTLISLARAASSFLAAAARSLCIRPQAAARPRRACVQGGFEVLDRFSGSSPGGRARRRAPRAWPAPRPTVAPYFFLRRASSSWRPSSASSAGRVGAHAPAQLAQAAGHLVDRDAGGLELVAALAQGLVEAAEVFEGAHRFLQGLQGRALPGVEQAVGGVGEVADAVGVLEQGQVGLELLLLARPQLGRVDLLELEAVELDAPAPLVIRHRARSRARPQALPQARWRPASSSRSRPSPAKASRASSWTAGLSKVWCSCWPWKSTRPSPKAARAAAPAGRPLRLARRLAGGVEFARARPSGPEPTWNCSRSAAGKSSASKRPFHRRGGPRRRAARRWWPARPAGTPGPR